MTTGFPIGAGSCPFLLVDVQGSDYVKSLGPVLKSASSKELEATETVQLPKGSRRIRIFEREAETTFIRNIHLRAYLANGVRASHSIYDENAAGGLLKLSFGESFVGDVPAAFLDALEVEISIQGFYVPDAPDR
jgi:hypothetical protein